MFEEGGRSLTFAFSGTQSKKRVKNGGSWPSVTIYTGLLTGNKPSSRMSISRNFCKYHKYNKLRNTKNRNMSFLLPKSYICCWISLIIKSCLHPCPKKNHTCYVLISFILKYQPNQKKKQRKLTRPRVRACCFDFMFEFSPIQTYTSVWQSSSNTSSVVKSSCTKLYTSFA